MSLTCRREQGDRPQDKRGPGRYERPAVRVVQQVNDQEWHGDRVKKQRTDQVPVDLVGRQGDEGQNGHDPARNEQAPGLAVYGKPNEERDGYAQQDGRAHIGAGHAVLRHPDGQADGAEDQRREEPAPLPQPVQEVAEEEEQAEGREDIGPGNRRDQPEVHPAHPVGQQGRAGQDEQQPPEDARDISFHGTLSSQPNSTCSFTKRQAHKGWKSMLNQSSYYK